MSCTRLGTAARLACSDERPCIHVSAGEDERVRGHYTSSWFTVGAREAI